MIDSSLPWSFACFGGCSPNTGDSEETEKSKVLWGGRFGRLLLCPGRAEKKPVAVGPLPGAYLSTETNLVPIRGVMKKEFDTGHTDTHTE